MEVIEAENGSISLIESDDYNYVGIESICDYMEALNEYDNAGCMINKDGIVTNSDTCGFFAASGSDKFSIIIGSEFNPLVYRGLNNDYVFMPDSLRYELFDGKERVRHCVNWIKKKEFLNLMSSTPYFTKPAKFKLFNYGFELDNEAVAKHYGYMSDYIDVTRDMMIAYFFAYTYFDKEKNQYLPIENFEYNSPTLYVSSLKDLYKRIPDSVKNICWQPMMRPYAQKTMSINVAEDWDIVQSLFKKVSLPKNPAISKYVYDLFEGGKQLFPADYIGRCAMQMRNYKTLHTDLIEAYCEETKTDIEWLKEELIMQEFEFVDQPWYIPEQANEFINKEIDENIIPYLEKGFVYRSKNI